MIYPSHIKKYLILLLVFARILSIEICKAQTVINRYYPVTAINPPSGGGSNCSDPTAGGTVTPLTFVVGSPTGAASPNLANGMQFLIIQMMAGSAGVIDQTNTSTYGNISNFGSAGNYEFAIIATVVGNNVTFTKDLVNTYDVAGKV